MITILIISLILGCAHPDGDTIVAKVVDPSSDNYEISLDKYKGSEFWPIWSMPIGNPSSTSHLKSNGQITYSSENAIDYDLNSAWIPDNVKPWGIGESIYFVFDFPENTTYAGAYQFQGICNVFNGYCKSLKTWDANSRVKRLKVYHNSTFICFVELVDTWHLQTFDISKYFVNNIDRRFLDADHEIVNGDTLRFEIMEVYRGTKYKDTAISEFLCEGAGN